MVKVVVPTLVSVTVFAGLVVPMATVPKLKLVGENFAVVPSPLSGTCWGLPVPLSVTRSAATRIPDAVGLKVKLMEQLAPPDNELPQVCVCAKSPAFVPAIAIAVMVKLVVPVFLSVTVFAGLVVPIASVEKVRLVGDKSALGAEIVASPLKGAFCEVCGIPK